LHGKIDLDRLQSAILELRAELNNGLSLSKKDSMTSLKKKEDDFKSLKGELENLENKAHKEISSLQDKLVKLAAQFDKELVMRDK
jgi:predicted  nucleic acid-binding Zn-ribbon protein